MVRSLRSVTLVLLTAWISSMSAVETLASLLDRQQPDGSWPAEPTVGLDAVTATAFGLLSLSNREPVVLGADGAAAAARAAAQLSKRMLADPQRPFDGRLDHLALGLWALGEWRQSRLDPAVAGADVLAVGLQRLLVEQVRLRQSSIRLGWPQQLEAEAIDTPTTVFALLAILAQDGLDADLRQTALTGIGNWLAVAWAAGNKKVNRLTARHRAHFPTAIVLPAGAKRAEVADDAPAAAWGLLAAVLLRQPDVDLLRHSLGQRLRADLPERWPAATPSERLVQIMAYRLHFSGPAMTDHLALLRGQLGAQRSPVLKLVLDDLLASTATPLLTRWMALGMTPVALSDEHVDLIDADLGDNSDRDDAEEAEAGGEPELAPPRLDLDQIIDIEVRGQGGGEVRWRVEQVIAPGAADEE